MKEHTPVSRALESATIAEVRRYWETEIHDASLSSHGIGSRDFFQDLADYHFEKLSYLPRLVRFEDYCRRTVLEVGCGLGIDLIRFAHAGAIVTGIDLSSRAIQLARLNFEQQGLTAELSVMDGEQLRCRGSSYDVVYAHGVLQYTANPQHMVREFHRVLKPGGEALVTVYNRYSWLSLLAKAGRVRLEHESAPCYRMYSRGELQCLLADFRQVTIVAERFPVRTQLHRGLKAAAYNGILVGLFNALPRWMVRPFGWHLVARAVK